jgi:signal recognition particle receptor subunit beta
MAVFNSVKKEINIKIVYCGPSLCGKTTNVQTIHEKLAPHQRGEMVSLATKDDRTLFFDFLPIELGNVKGFKTRFHIYTVPGQVYYGLTRRAVLTNVDGVVFVADSQKDKMEANLESFKDLEENLKFYKKNILSTPVVIQYNKRDLPDIMPVDEINTALNKLQFPFFEASAVQGPGVLETLTACCKLILKKLDESSAKKEGPLIRIFKEPEPYAASVLQQQEEAMAGTGPVIRISSEAIADEPRSAEPPVPIPFTIPSSPPEQPATLHLPAGSPSTVADIIPAGDEVPQGPFNLTQDAATPDSGTLLAAGSAAASIQSLTISAEIEPEQEAQFKIIACGQPQKESATSIKVPLIFQISELNKECLINITISFDNFTMREPR